MDQRRAEIEAKRARLEEMRRKRETKERAATVSPQPQSQPQQWKSVAAVVAHAPRQVRYSKGTQTDPVPQPETEPAHQSRESRPDQGTESMQSGQSGQSCPIDQADQVDQSDESGQAIAELSLDTFTESPHHDPELVGAFLENAFKVFERARTDLLVRYDRHPTARPTPQTVQVSLQLPGPLNITAIEWSPHHRSLVACAYGNANSILGPRGSCVLLWSLEFPASPEYTLKAPTDITHIKFSTTNPWFVYGAGYNGQVYIWDLRQGREILSSMRSHADGEGHLLPVCALDTAPGINHDVLVSLAVDGTLCMWPNDRLVRPQHKITLAPPEKTAAIASTCMALWHGDYSTFLVGTLEGAIYTGRRSDSVGAKAGIAADLPVYTGHTAPVTSIQYHPIINDSRVFISASLDWSVRVWKVSGQATGQAAGQATSHSMEFQLPDAVTAVAWSPHNAPCFACCYRNVLEIWNLGRDTQEPAARYELEDLATSIAWDPYIRTRLVCGSKTTAVVLDIAGDLLDGTYEF